MEGNYEKLYEGLALVYRGMWIGLIGVVSTVLLVWIPILSFLCMLAALLGGAIVIVGQVKLLSEHKDYKKVLVLVIMAALFNLIEQGISGVVGRGVSWEYMFAAGAIFSDSRHQSLFASAEPRGFGGAGEKDSDGEYSLYHSGSGFGGDACDVSGELWGAACGGGGFCCFGDSQ